MANNTSDKINNIVVVGAGPIGLVHALGFKKLNPHLNVTVLEKYDEYQRSHTLVMQAEALKAFMVATKTEEEPKLAELLARIKKDPHIRTNELENILKTLALQNGVQIKNEEIHDGIIAQQLAAYQPDLIIGADGTHSVVNRNLFPKDNHVKIEFDYVLQLRYEIDGNKKTQSIHPLEFYQEMARHGMIANEYVGHFDEVNKKTPVTMQMMISKEAFLKLKAATSKHPIHLFGSDNEISDISLDDVPEDIQSFLHHYLVNKIQKTNEQTIEKDSIRISVNEAPATYAKTPVYNVNGIPVILVGDAGLGLSYFKGLNAGLFSTAKLFSFLAPDFSLDALQQSKINKHLQAYRRWFLNDFAPKKIKEVEQYSNWRIRSLMKVMRKLRSIKEFSYAENLYVDNNIIADYFRLLANNPAKTRDAHAPFYPHRKHDLVRFGQLDYVPPSYTFAQIKKTFVDYFKPYKTVTQLKRDFKQPAIGGVNFLIGLLKVLSSPFTSRKFLADGLSNLFRGTLEIVTAPLTWIKPITRGAFTLIKGVQKIEDNKGLNRVIEQGKALIKNNSKDNLQADPENKYTLLAIADDLHRKFNKALKRKQPTQIKILEEEAAFTKACSEINIGNTASLLQYFSVFASNANLSQQQSRLLCNDKEIDNETKFEIVNR